MKLADLPHLVIEALRAIGRTLVVLIEATGRGLAVLWQIAGPRILAASSAIAAGWRALPIPARWTLAAVIAIIALLMTLWTWRTWIGHWYEAEIAKSRPLYAARSWHYQLDKIDVDRIAQSDADLLVIDYAKEDGGKPLSKEEVARLKVKKNGKKRLVVAYISIGEAESYRFYWREDWKDDDMPGWHVAENCSWPRNHMVRFWHDGWKDIVYRGKRSYLARIIEAGFDGVYLDRIDVYWEQMKTRPTARADMIAFVKEMAETARKLKPGFLFIAQNAEDLLSDKSYRDIIDGLGKEDLLHGLHGTNNRNTNAEIADSFAAIRRLLADWKPVFAVEYVQKKELIDSARTELERLGLVPTFAHRSLDGFDPLMERPNQDKQYGTPEWTERECKAKGKPYW